MTGTHRSTKRFYGKANAGPGGLHCPCCAPVIGKTASKRFVNRWCRRKANEVCRGLVKDSEND